MLNFRERPSDERPRKGNLPRRESSSHLHAVLIQFNCLQSVQILLNQFRARKDTNIGANVLRLSRLVLAD